MELVGWGDEETSVERQVTSTTTVLLGKKSGWHVQRCTAGANTINMQAWLKS